MADEVAPDHITIAAPEPIDRERRQKTNTGGLGFNLRKTFSRGSNLSRERSRRASDVESTYDQEFERERGVDVTHKQEYSGWPLFLLAYQSAGVIYGDIGTSPIYVFSSTFTESPQYDDLLGALSIIIWTLTLIVTVKYVVIVLNADNRGQGGTFAMYSLLTRYSKISTADDPANNDMIKLARYDTTEMGGNLGFRGLLERSKIAKYLLSLIACFGVSLIISDGVLTPAQSILGAVQGLTVVAPDLGLGAIVGITCAILVFLFVIQPFGVAKLGSVFAPVVIIWLLLNFSFGVYNLAVHDHSVLKAFSPYFAGLYFVRNKTKAWESMGGLLLSFTGVEALFADLGAFSKRAIQISWLGLAYPCLLMAYIGQSAYLSRNPDDYTNPFFNAAPPGTFWFAFIMAILASIVASQALITSTFQLLFQVINMSYFPPISYRYTSVKHHSQIYIPIANWLLMIGTIAVTAGFQDTTKLGNAYGVCVILDTTITTTLVSLVAVIVWRIRWYFVLPVWLIYATFEGLYMTSAVRKVPDGAWFTLSLAFIIASTFTLWRYGKERQWRVERKGRLRMNRLITKDGSVNSGLRLDLGLGGGEIITTKGMGIFFDKAGGNDYVPQPYEEYVKRFEAQPLVQVFLHLRGTQVPFVPAEDRFAITKASLPNAYRMVIRYGYAEVPGNAQLGDTVYREIRKYVQTLSDRGAPPQVAEVIQNAAPTWESTLPEEQSAAQSSMKKRNTSIVIEMKPLSDAEASSSSGGAITSGLAPGVQPSAIGNAIKPNTEPAIPDSDVQRRLEALDTAHNSQTLYIFGREQLRLVSAADLRAEVEAATAHSDDGEADSDDLKANNKSLSQRIAEKRQKLGHNVVGRRYNPFEWLALSVYMWFRDVTSSKVSSYRVPMDRVIEVGFVKNL